MVYITPIYDVPEGAHYLADLRSYILMLQICNLVGVSQGGLTRGWPTFLASFFFVFGRGSGGFISPKKMGG